VSALSLALGGGAITTLGVALWALWERLQRAKAQATSDRWRNAYERAAEQAESAAEEIQAERALRVDDKRRLEGLVSQYQTRVRRLEDAVAKYAARDPVSAGDYLAGVLLGGGQPTAGAQAGAPRPDPDRPRTHPRLDPGPGDPGQSGRGGH
jgi:hypothetical protein